ncbi:helix-turn-helix domain-containing protein [Sphingobium scionense]
MTHPALVPPLAIERYRVLEPHLADGIPLADLARTGTLSERTLQRWLGRYRAEGLAGLARLPRNDRGRLHLPEHLVELTRTLATKRPRPPVAAIHRKVQELAIAHGHRTPSYAVASRVSSGRYRQARSPQPPIRRLPRPARASASARSRDLERDVAGRSYRSRHSRAR